MDKILTLVMRVPPYYSVKLTGNDGWFIECLDMKECCARGSTISEAFENLGDVMESFLAEKEEEASNG